MSGHSRRSAWPEGVTTPLVSPIQPSVVYTSDAPSTLDSVYEGDAAGYTYAREGHPNATVLARRIAAMEGAGQGLVTGSGMAAVGAVLFGRAWPEQFAQKWEPVWSFSDMPNQKVGADRVNADERDTLQGSLLRQGPDHVEIEPRAERPDFCQHDPWVRQVV